MKKIATLVAAIAMFAASSVASAADNLWFSLVSSSNPAITATSSGPGQPLNLLNPTGEAATVRIGINLTSDTGALAGWNIALNSTPGGTFANGAAAGTGYDQTVGSDPNGTASFDVGRGSGSVSGSTGLVYQFDLVVGGGALPLAVTGDFGALGIVKSNAFYWYGFVGNNPLSIAGGSGYTAPSYGDTTPGWGALPVITMVVPEPATLGLLAIGAIALIRRRK